MLAGISVAPAQKGGSSTKKADLVDGKGKKGQFVHENGRFGGWQGQKGSSSTKMADLVDGKGKVSLTEKG